MLSTHKNTRKPNTFYYEGHEENEADRSQRITADNTVIR